MTHRRPHAIVSVALAIGLLGACGGRDGHERAAADVLQQTFRSSDSAIEDGYLSLCVRLDPEGPLAASGPLLFTLLGPFSRTGGAERFDVEFAATLAREQYVATLLSTGQRSLVTLDDKTYELDAGRRRSVSTPRRDRLPVTGFDPLRWIRGAAIKGTERAVGVNTVRLGGRVAVERLLQEIDGMFTHTAGSGSGAILLSPKLRGQIAGAVTSSWIDIWTSAPDRLLRQVAVRFAFAFSDGDSPLPALTGGKVNVHLRLDDVNERATPSAAFAAPSGPPSRPLSDLTGGTDTGEILRRVGAGLAGSRRRALFACLGTANGSSGSLVRCAARRAG